MIWTIACALALAAWVGVLAVPWRPHTTREQLEPAADAPPIDFADVTVVIPARNEAAMLETTIEGLARQGPGLAVVLVDDASSDATVAVAQRTAQRYSMTLNVVRGAPLPSGWAGKLWALEQGLATVRTPRTLLLDADIELAPGMVAALLKHARETRADLVSIMAELRCVSFWERLLTPAFVFFFKLLYPFALASSPRHRMAAAAGGCMLVATEALRGIGGFGAIRGALIDDCALALALKRRGHRLWIGLSHSVRSRRPYDRLADFWRMVARTAYTQLRYSAALLLGTVVAMIVVFVAPLATLVAAPSPLAVALAAGALGAMCAAYLPVTRFYGLPALWTLTLPAAALLYLAMTVSSALNYWRGTRATWKGRSYDRSE